MSDDENQQNFKSSVDQRDLSGRLSLSPSSTCLPPTPLEKVPDSFLGTVSIFSGTHDIGGSVTTNENDVKTITSPFVFFFYTIETNLL